MATTRPLEAAYRATTYRVFLPDGPCDLRIGQDSPGLAAWMNGLGAAGAAIITAHNPRSQPLPAVDNEYRQHQLEAALLAAGARLWPALNLPDSAEWPGEAACLALGVDFKRSCTFAREYGQNALVYCGADGVPQLVWLDESE